MASNLEHLRTIVTVWRERSISRAAHVLDLTQPTVSAHVKAMENAVGRPLFHRTAKGVQPTPTADELIRSVGDTLELADAAVEKIRVRSDTSDSVLHLGAPAEFANARLSSVFAQLIRSGLQPRLRTGGRTQLYQWFDTGEIDLGIVASEPQMASLDWQPVYVERLLLVGTADHRPDADMRLSTWVRQANWLAYDESMPLIRQWSAKVAGQGAIGKPVFTVPSLTLLRDIACRGVGVTVLPDYLCQNAIAEGPLQILHQPQNDPRNVVSLCWRRQALRNAQVTRARDIFLAELAVS